MVNTSDGRVVRAFHRFTLLDQGGQGRDLMKGRSRAQGAVKISCARQVRLQAGVWDCPSQGTLISTLWTSKNGS